MLPCAAFTDTHTSTEMHTLRLDSVVRGHHIYKDIWSSMIGEELQCVREVGNVHDLYAVGVVKTGTGTVGHLPKKISTPCHLFLRKGGTILCTITGRRQYSVDLPQGGLEIPCKLTLKGDTKSVEKVKQLLHKVSSISPTEVSSEKAPDCKETTCKCKPSPSKSTPKPIFVSEVVVGRNVDKEHVWVSAKNTLLLADKEVLLTHGSSLTDKHINYAQALLRQQFTCVGGLQSTLFQYKPLQDKLPEGIQIIHCHGCHWVVAHKVASSSDVVKVYDSLYDEVDDVVKKVVTNLFLFSECPIIEMVPMQKQAVSSNNCGLFAIAICVAILLKENPSVIVFKEDMMRSHLCFCFEQSVMTRFPCS